MDSAAVAIRIFVGSALAALVAALIVVATMGPVTSRKLAPSISVSIPVLKSPAALQKREQSRQLLPDTYTTLRVATPRRASVIDNCFSADSGIISPASATENAIVAAAQHRNWNTVRRMLEAGAPVDSANDAGVTPLMIAASHGETDVIGVLVRRHANVNYKDLGGRSALSYAVDGRQLTAVQSLLPLVSDTEITSPGERDLLTAAFEAGETKIFQALLERIPETTLQWSAGTRTALESAVRADDKEQVRFLLSKHIGPPISESGVPLIAYAIAKEDATMFNALIVSGGDPNLLIPKTAEKEFLALLKSKSLRSYIQDDGGVNLLMLAAGLGKHEYVRALLDAGADRNRTTARGTMRPLYFAAWTGNWRSIQMLLGSGPMPDQLRLEISLAKQNMTVIKDGKTILTTQCSTGREGFTTPTGEYVITDKDRDHRSTIYKVPMPYFMRLNCRDFGMHAGVVASYPASHGCIRLPSGVARRLFSEIPVGTVVMIN